MLSPPKGECKVLQSKREICEAFQIGERRFQRWVERGLPAKLVDGRWVAHRERVEEFFAIWLSSCKDEN